MSFRYRLVFGAVVYFGLIAVIGLLAVAAVDELDENVVNLVSVDKEYRTCQALNSRANDVVSGARRWGRAELPRERQMAFKALGMLRRELRDKMVFRQTILPAGMADLLVQILEDVEREATGILGLDAPRRDAELSARLSRLGELDEALEYIFSYYLEALENRRFEVLSRGEEYRGRLPLVFSILVAAAFLLTAGFVWMAVKTMSVPLDRLLSGAERVASGEFSHRINLDRRDEFGQLAERFDFMAGQVQSSHDNLTRKLEQTALLMEISKGAAGTLDLRGMIETMATTVAVRLGFDAFSVYLRAASGEVSLFASRGRDADSPPTEQERRIVADAVAGVRTATGYDEGPAGRERSGDTRAASLIALPIQRGEEGLGAFAIRRREPRGFSEDEVNLLGMMANTVAGAIANAELYARTRHQLERTRTIYEFGKSISSTLETEQLLPYFCRETARILNGKACVVRLAENGRLIVRAFHGVQPEGFRAEEAIGEGIVGGVAENGRPVIGSGDDVVAVEGRGAPLSDARSIIVAPLKYGERIIGTIGLYDKSVGDREEPFDEEDLETLEAIASVASIAIENARLYNEERRREERLMIAHRRLETLFETVQGGILTVDSELRIRAANRFVEQWTDRSVDELVGVPCTESMDFGGDFCPLDLVRATFDTGERQIIAQRVEKGGTPFYFEVTTYPVRDPSGNVGEVVVFVQDVSERMRYQEEIYGLYTQVAQTKEYLESLISNSADAIITTDAEGIITSWNQGAERIYGYDESEVIGKTFPMVPEFLLPAEKNHTERILGRETIKDLETLRRRKDGQLIEVSLTLSPILDGAGKVVGISGISRDISGRKRVEQELTRRNQELQRLLFISTAMRSTLNLERLLRMTLTSVTMSDGLGFNRSMLFLVNEDKGVIQGKIGVGPASLEEAWQIWGRMSLERKSLEEIMAEMEHAGPDQESFLDRLAANITVSLNDEQSILAKVLRDREPVNIADARSDPRVDPVIVQQLGTEAFVLIPLVARDKAVGILWADNLFNRRPITEDDVRFLSGFANQVTSAIENARLFEKVSRAEAELENIFASISDMVYFNDAEFTIQRVNQAVVDRIGLPAERIIGRKCYEVFHGTQEPWEKCPHARTLRTGDPYVEEVNDPHMGGTFVISSSPIFATNGRITGTVHISRDVTESHRLRRRLAKSEKMAALGEMAAKIAHEIRNPLISVGGFARRLEKSLDPPAKDYATIIVDSVNHLEVILKELLGFVKETRIVPIKADLREILDGIIALFNPTFKERGIGIVREYPENGLEVPVDSNKIREAFTNILTNAEQAMERPGRIIVRAWQEGDMAVVEVSDEGPGMGEDVLRHLFDPFYTTKMTGTGLGLAITQKIVELHGGKIEVGSKPGEGSTFRIHLPIKEVPDEDTGG